MLPLMTSTALFCLGEDLGGEFRIVTGGDWKRTGPLHVLLLLSSSSDSLSCCLCRLCTSAVREGVSVSFIETTSTSPFPSRDARFHFFQLGGDGNTSSLGMDDSYPSFRSLDVGRPRTVFGHVGIWICAKLRTGSYGRIAS